jgi:hypothetical protein
MAQSSFPSTSVNGNKVAQIVVPVRLNRGGANQDQMFLVRENHPNPVPDDQ